MGNRFGYTINGPQHEVAGLPMRLATSPLASRDPDPDGNSLRDLCQRPAPVADYHDSSSSTENGYPTPEIPNLPPTPPNAEDDFNGVADEVTSTTETAKARSVLTTPVHQVSPPTPDNTPPREKPRIRPFLGAQPSMTSTRADSFRTAHEEFSSDKGSILSLPLPASDQIHTSPYTLPYLTNSVHKHSPLANLPITNFDHDSKASIPNLLSAVTTLPGPGANDEQANDATNDHVLVAPNEVRGAGSPQRQDPIDGSAVVMNPPMIRSKKEGARRGQSLRERLEDSQHKSSSPSIDKFASIIGWSNDVHGSADHYKRWSGASNTSTVAAMLIEKPRMQTKRNTLRHVSKNDSLRSTSSPLPSSNRASAQSCSGSPHRLIHKNAKLGNHNRLSFGSEISRNASLELSAAPPIEIIRVAIIPERSSSLHQSRVSSRRQSYSTTGAPPSFQMPPFDNSQRKRAKTDSTDRSHERHYPPQVPPRNSSISAPTSRNTSRANSIGSDHVRFQRKKAEKELRNTLTRMESERLSSSLKSESVGSAPRSRRAEEVLPSDKGSIAAGEWFTDTHVPDFSVHPDPRVTYLKPGSGEWAELRPTYTLQSIFSQPSLMSASPEISEAKMISLHVHNNHSVQLIEPFPSAQSHAVEEARRLQYLDLQNGQTLDSPLRNPREPPPTPQFNVIPATPQGAMHIMLGHDGQPNINPSTPKRPPVRTRTDSFAKNLIRTVSLKNTRNKKADQDLDSSLNPFWRPRPFWDGIEPISPEKKREVESAERGIVNNSLGLPQPRTVMSGPVELMRKLSERRRQNKILAKQSSYNSLQRLRTGQKLYRLPGFGTYLHFMSIQEIQDRIYMSRQRRDDDKREKRRAALRKSIGPNVIATGDSRFPTAMMGEELER